MRKRLRDLTLIALLFGFAVTASSMATGTRVLDFHKGGKKSRINFALHKAKGVTCNDCHHLHKSGKRYFKKCGTCHNTAADALKVGHATCIGCHKRKRGPTTCKGCH